MTDLNSPARIFAGAMSGTSCDGVDVALVKISGHGFAMQAELLLHGANDYPPSLRNRILDVRNRGDVALSELAKLAADVSEQYALAVNKALQISGHAADSIAAIAAHGQTLFHQPPFTLQWLDPSLLAAKTGIDVVSDFRRADCAAGGQGAPLVPFADFILFGQTGKTRVLLNIGGIANITFLPASGVITDIIAFDTGPGNCIMDHLMRQAYPDKNYDEGGAIAKTGRVRDDLIEHFLADDFVQKKWPKSTDGPAMIAIFENARQKTGQTLSLQDQLATASEISCRLIRMAIDTLPSIPTEIIASGGGTRNVHLWDRLRAAHADSPTRISTTDNYQIPSSAKEAMAFALLGAATLDRFPSNIPAATGASNSVVLGSISPKPTSV